MQNHHDQNDELTYAQKEGEWERKSIKTMIGALRANNKASKFSQEKLVAHWMIEILKQTVFSLSFYLWLFAIFLSLLIPAFLLSGFGVTTIFSLPATLLCGGLVIRMFIKAQLAEAVMKSETLAQAGQ